jgi:hypothetical protein
MNGMLQNSPNGICVAVKTEVLRQDSNSVVSSVVMAEIGADDSGILRRCFSDCATPLPR